MSTLDLITDHLDIWTTAQAEKVTGRGKSTNNHSIYGIKKLRELILELAVRGKLVPQDPTDEPASVLLHKISEEKARLAKSGKTNKQKSFLNVSDNEKQFGLPSGWAWFRVGNVLNFQYGKAMAAKHRDPSGNVDVYGSNGIVGKHSETLIKAPCIVIGRKGSAGALNKACGPSWITDVAYFLVPPDGFNFDYTYLILESLRLDRLGKGIKPGVNRNEAYALVASLPPLSEQHRIVAKVDELMALCDQLEQQQTNSNATHQTLVETLLAALTRPTTGADGTESNAIELFFQHFNILFTTEQSIDQLKQTILQLAVMGKLVPQDPDDEPASILLRRIAEEKVRLIDAGKIRRQKPLPDISETEKPFALPRGWVLSRLDNVMDITSGVTKGRKLAGRAVVSVPYLRVANVQRGFLLLEQIKEIDIPEGEISKFTVVKRDLLITEGGDWDKVGRTAIWGGELPLVAHQNHVFKARRFLNEQNENWLEKFLNSSFARDYFAGSSKQTTNLASINKTQLRGCIVAIPPLAEQQRIVAKVEEFTAFCDALKAQLCDAQTTQLQIADSIVEQAVTLA